jgi:hypothetical protein
MYFVSFAKKYAGRTEVLASRNGLPSEHKGAIHKGSSGQYYVILKDWPVMRHRTLKQAKEYVRGLYNA